MKDRVNDEAKGINVAPYAEIEVPTPAADSPARLALYEVQREQQELEGRATNAA